MKAMYCQVVLAWFTLAAFVSEPAAHAQLASQMAKLWQEQQAASARPTSQVFGASLKGTWGDDDHLLGDRNHLPPRPLSSANINGQGSSWYSPPSNPDFFRTFHHVPFLGSSAYQPSTGQLLDCGSSARCQDIWRGLCRDGECCGDFGVSAFDWIRRRYPRRR